MGKKEKVIEGDIELGDLARDRLSGFEGVVMARTDWITGCSRLVLQPRTLTKDGMPMAMETFDLFLLDLVEKNVQPVADSTAGGPTPNAVRR